MVTKGETFLEKTISSTSTEGQGHVWTREANRRRGPFFDFSPLFGHVTALFLFVSLCRKLEVARSASTTSDLPPLSIIDYPPSHSHDHIMSELTPFLDETSPEDYADLLKNASRFTERHLPLD